MEDSAVAAGRTVLVAEDNSVNRKVLQVFLQKFGATVLLAEDGVQAVAQVAAHPEVEIIFMDILMPEKDGMEATAELRQRGWRGIIIACTATEDSAEWDAYRAGGVNDVLIKPCKKEGIRAMLEKWGTALSIPDGSGGGDGRSAALQTAGGGDKSSTTLQTAGDGNESSAALQTAGGGDESGATLQTAGAGSASGAALQTAGVDSASSATLQPAALPLWNPAELLEAVGGNRALVQSLMADYCTQASTILAQTAAALRSPAPDFAALHALGHKLAGSSGAVSAHGLALSAQALDAAALAHNAALVQAAQQQCASGLRAVQEHVARWCGPVAP